MAQPYAAYPPQGGYYPPGYDYSGYYQQQAYDPHHAYWQQYQYGAAPPAGQPQQRQPQQQAPQPPQAPPLPADEPPPLPPDDAEAPAAQAAAAEKAGAEAAAPPPPPPPAQAQETAAGAAQAATDQAKQQQQQHQQPPAQQQSPQVAGVDGSNANGPNCASHAAQYGHYASYGAGYYGGYGAPPAYGAPPPYGAPPGYGYPAYGSYDPSSNSSYAPQVQQQYNASHPPGLAPSGLTQGSAAPSTETPGKASRWNRAPPPSSLTAGANVKPTAIKPATIVSGGNAAGGIGTLDAAQVAAARSAAAAAAARIAAGAGAKPNQQQQFISVSNAAGGGGVQAQAQPAAQQALPASFQQYVQRALLRASGSQPKQDKLKEILKVMIAEHRKAGTMWSTDWDRLPLPDLDGSPTGAGGRSSVFDRMSSPKGYQGWDSRDRDERDSRSRYRDDSDDDSRGGYKGGYRGDSYRDKYSPHSKRSKRGWDDSRYDSSEGSDDERSDSRDDEEMGYGQGKLGYGGKKKQRLDLQGSGGGRGKGRGKKQQQGGRGRGKGRNNPQQAQLSAADAARAAARSARFGGSAAGTQLAAYGWEDDGSQGDGGFIVGTCQKLEKRYLRLTRPPASDEVRPQPVLAAALRRLLGMIESKADKYLYYNDQFKAMRQDLTVQGIKNDFTVQVYEAHARAALEYGDNAEYNQCQAQLAILYAKGLPGSHAEFGAYRLLYQAVYAQHGEGRKLLGTLRQLVGNRVGQVADSPEVQHAMQVRQALANGNVLRFFRLYSSAPLLSRRLMDAAVKQLRFKALSALVRTHKPTVILLPFLTRSLGFVAQPQDPAAAAGADGPAGGDPMEMETQLGALTVDGAGSLLPGCSEQRCVGDYMPSTDEAEALAACLEWCKLHGAVFDQESDLHTSALVTKECWNKLFVPVDTSKVAHGDANLDIRDFLAACN